MLGTGTGGGFHKGFAFGVGPWPVVREGAAVTGGDIRVQRRVQGCVQHGVQHRVRPGGGTAVVGECGGRFTPSAGTLPR